jgi:hypothetical protein
MLFCDTTAAETDTSASTADAGKIRTGGGYRPAASKAGKGKSQVTNDTTAAPETADKGKVRLGGGYRPAADTTDAGKVRLGGGYRLPTQNA